MVMVRGSKLNLPNPSLSSLVFDPKSRSLALTYTDSSFSLYHSLSPLSSSLLSHNRTLIPPPSSSSCFVSIQTSDSVPLFVVAGPHNGGSRICLRFFAVVEGKAFARVRAVCNQKGITFDDRSGVLVDCSHGVSVRLAGSANFFAVNWISGSEVWVFAVKMVGDGVVKLMRCAVIECRKPVFSIEFCFGLLVLGEENGVRAFSLRQLVKGRIRKVNASQAGQKLRGDNSGRNCERNSEFDCKCSSNEMNRGNVSGKYRAIRLQQESCEVGTYFVEFGGRDVEASSKSRMNSLLKATSIQTLSPKRCLVLDSAGNLHDLHLSTGSGMIPRMRQLPRVMNVQKLAVLAESSSGTQTIWVSDGYNSLHVISMPDIKAVVNDTESTEAENSVQISVMQTIFTCEKIEDVAPLAGNAVLILGQVYTLMKFPKVQLSRFPIVFGRADIGALFQFMRFFPWLLGFLACFCFTIHDLLTSHYERVIETAKPIKGIRGSGNCSAL